MLLPSRREDLERLIGQTFAPFDGWRPWQGGIEPGGAQSMPSKRSPHSPLSMPARWRRSTSIRSLSTPAAPWRRRIDRRVCRLTRSRACRETTGPRTPGSALLRRPAGARGSQPRARRRLDVTDLGAALMSSASSSGVPSGSPRRSCLLATRSRRPVRALPGGRNVGRAPAELHLTAYTAGFSPRRCRSTSSSSITSALIISISNRFTRCGTSARSATHSSGMITR
jgi:hypothetical protein